MNHKQVLNKKSDLTSDHKGSQKTLQIFALFVFHVSFLVFSGCSGNFQSQKLGDQAGNLTGNQIQLFSQSGSDLISKSIQGQIFSENLNQNTNSLIAETKRQEQEAEFSLQNSDQQSAAASQDPKNKIIVGTDNRLDYHQAPYPQNLTMLSTGALIQSTQLNANGDLFVTNWKDVFFKNFRMFTGAAGSVDPKPLCSSERFLDQNTAGGCSFTLISPNFAITAGHCMMDTPCPRSTTNTPTVCELDDVAATNSFGACARTSLVFDYNVDQAGGKGRSKFSKDQVRKCKRARSRQSGFTFGAVQDVSIIELDRPVCDRPYVDLATRDMQKNEAVNVIGHPVGLPSKLSISTYRGYIYDYSWGVSTKPLLPNFQAIVGDTFSGNSGSGVFDRDQKLQGVLVTQGNVKSFSEATPSDPGFVASEPGCYISTSYPENCDLLDPSNPKFCRFGGTIGRAGFPKEWMPANPGLERAQVCQSDLIKPLATTSNASYALAIAPGSLATVFGEGFWQGQSWQATVLPLPTKVQEFEVRVNGVASELVFISANQVNFIVPTNLALTGNKPVARVEVIRSGKIVGVQSNLIIRKAQPAIYTLGSVGANGYALGFHYSTGKAETLISNSGSPAVVSGRAGNLLELYGTGIKGAGTVTAMIEGKAAKVIYFGAVQGFPGLDQVNLEIPAGVAGIERDVSIVLSTQESVFESSIDVSGGNQAAATTARIDSAAVLIRIK